MLLTLVELILGIGNLVYRKKLLRETSPSIPEIVQSWRAKKIPGTPAI